MATLQDTLSGGRDGHEVREAIRALVEAIVLVPDDGRLAIEVKGDLAAILALGANASTRREGQVHEALRERVKLGAGAPIKPSPYLQTGSAPSAAVRDVQQR